MIPIMNGMREVMPALALLKQNTSSDTEWMIVDNGSTERVEDYIRKYIKPYKLNYIRNEENPGLVKVNQRAYEECETEILMLLHADVYIYEKNWDQRVISYFKEIPDLGIAGFFGAQGCLPNGGRIQDIEKRGQMSGWSNMVEAEIHGMRMTQPWHSVAIFDSFGMILSMKFLKDSGGFDTNLKYHHYYDRDISLESLRHGYKNVVVDILNHHTGNIAASNDLYQEWQKKEIGNATDSIRIHNENKEYFINKWKEVLPLYVEDDFSFREGVMPIPYEPGTDGKVVRLTYGGNRIVGYGKKN